jgi:hypothetical protein
MSNTPTPTPTPTTTPTPGGSLNPSDFLATHPIPGAGGTNTSEISDQKIREILSGLDDIKRNQIQAILQQKGWYGSAKRGNGFANSDLNAFKSLYQVAIAKGTDWQTALGEVAKGPDFFLGGGSNVGRVPSPLDLKEVLQQTALTVMGRKLDDKAVSNLVSSYQSASNGTASTTAPAADTFFKSRIEQKYGAESDATKYLSAISNVSKVLGSL